MNTRPYSAVVGIVQPHCRIEDFSLGIVTYIDGLVFESGENIQIEKQFRFHLPPNPTGSKVNETQTFDCSRHKLSYVVLNRNHIRNEKDYYN